MPTFMKASKGMLCAVGEKHSFTTPTGKSTSTKVLHLAKVTHANRAGVVIKFRKIGVSLAEQKAEDVEYTYLIKKGQFDEDALVANLEGLLKEDWQANDFADLEDVKKYVLKFKLGN